MKINILIGLAIVGMLSFAACENAENKQPNKSVANSGANKSNAANLSNTNSSAPQSDIKRGKGEGKVTKIDLNLGSIGMDHDEIKGEISMPAMPMEFYVKDKAIPSDLKVGDTVTFTLEDNKGAEQITDVKKKETAK